MDSSAVCWATDVVRAPVLYKIKLERLEADY